MKNKLNDKGFSLVELIIVIAIMAILIGGVTPQVIKYVEKSRVAKDTQVLQTVFTAAQTAILTDEKAVGNSLVTDVKRLFAETPEPALTTWETEIKSLLSDDLTSKLASKDANSKNIYIKYTHTTGKIEVGVTADSPATLTSTPIGTVTQVTN